METPGPQDEPVRVAIIGSGLAGLTAAYLLTSSTETVGQSLRIELLERNTRLGMDSESVTYEFQGQKCRIDVPMRAFSQGFYPELVKLYRHFHIPFAPTSFTFAFGASLASDTRQPGPEPTILYNGLRTRRPFGFQQPGKSFLASMWMIFKISWSYLVVNMAAWYHVHLGHTRDPDHYIRKINFGQWCDESWVLSSFLAELLIPMLCSIMTADYETVRAIPAAEMLDYIVATFSNQHYTVQGGVSQVVEALTSNMKPEQIHLGLTVKDLIPLSEGQKTRVHLVCEHKISGKEKHLIYDHIIFASQASQTARMLQQFCDHLHGHMSELPVAPYQETVSQLNKLCYKQSTVVCHTDASVIAPRKEAWRDLNFIRAIPRESTDATYTMATHIICQKDASVVMQTTNPLPWLFPNESTWISKSDFERFVLTLSGCEARRAFFDYEMSHGKYTKHPKLGPLQGVGPVNLREASMPGIWLCGSWSYGVPLLEGTVVIINFRLRYQRAAGGQ